MSSEYDLVDWAHPDQLESFSRMDPRQRKVLSEYLLHLGRIPQDGLFIMLGEKGAGEILADLQRWVRNAYDWKRQVEERERQLQRMKDDFGYSIFGGFEAGKSPRPMQFDFVAGFFSAEESRVNQYIQIRNYRRESFGMPYRGLFLHGPSGTTKSASAWLAATGYIESHEEPAKLVSTSYLASVASQKHLDADLCRDFSELVQECLDVSLLILDDIGTEEMSGKAYEAALFRIIDERTKAGDLWTIITSNFNPEDLCERIFTSANKGKILRRINDYFLPVDFNHVG